MRQGRFFSTINSSRLPKPLKPKECTDVITCGRERCGAQNSPHARRCLGKDMRPDPVGRLAPDPRGRVIPGLPLFVVEPDGRAVRFGDRQRYVLNALRRMTRWRVVVALRLYAD